MNVLIFFLTVINRAKLGTFSLNKVMRKILLKIRAFISSLGLFENFGWRYEKKVRVHFQSVVKVLVL